MFRVAVRLSLFFLVLLGLTGRAAAHPWMIRHGYTQCATCHVDPSGSGLLTSYGRAQSALLLSSRYNLPKDATPDRSKDFAFGVPEPSWLTLGAWARYGYIWNRSDGRLVDRRFLQMRGDLAAQVRYKWFRAAGSLGYASDDAPGLSQRAWLTRNEDKYNLVSREHWLGADLVQGKSLLRAGRIGLPFGLRNVEHTSWVRSETRTDINQSQQFGVAYAHAADHWRAELMAIAGNFQVRPDDFRERGYSGYVEWAPTQHAAVGASSLLTHAQADIDLRQENLRQAHGIFARVAPWQPLVLMLEVDALLQRVGDDGLQAGAVGLLQADYEFWQGLHLVANGEFLRQAAAGSDVRWGAWGGLWWFPWAHIETRFDVIWRGGGDGPASTTFLLQGQLYL